MTTINKYLASVPASDKNVSEEIYKQVKEECAGWASWAIWGEQTPDLSIFTDSEKPWKKLRRDVLLLGGNLGGSIENFSGATPSPFSNFHTPGHAGDTKLRNAVSGTVLEGAFLSDVIKNYPTANNSELMKVIKEGKIDLEKCFVEPLQKELKALDAPDNAVVVLLGKATGNLWRTLAKKMGDDFPFGNLQIIDDVKHYGAPVNFTDEIASLLDRPMPK